jgi:hypothetical protein
VNRIEARTNVRVGERAEKGGLRGLLEHALAKSFDESDLGEPRCDEVDSDRRVRELRLEQLDRTAELA